MYLKSAGFDQGFDEWKLVPGITFDPNTDRDVTSPGSERLAEQLLGEAANRGRRFFFWAHFLDPHDLYQAHEGIDWGRSPRDRYDGAVRFTDRYVGKLLDFSFRRFVRFLDNTDRMAPDRVQELADLLKLLRS